MQKTVDTHMSAVRRPYLCAYTYTHAHMHTYRKPMSAVLFVRIYIQTCTHAYIQKAVDTHMSAVRELDAAPLFVCEKGVRLTSKDNR